MKKTYRFPINPIVGIKTVFLLLVILAAGILYLKIQEPAKRSADFTRLQQESYQGVFFSMYAPEAFPEDIYPTYMGYDAVVCSHRIASFSDLSDYLETAFSSDNEVTHVFLMLDPLLLWDSSLHQNALFTASLEEKLLAYVDTYAGAEFTVIFSTPSLAYWQSHADDDLDTYCNVIRILAAPQEQRGVKCCRRPLHHAVSTERCHAVPGDGKLQQSGAVFRTGAAGSLFPCHLSRPVRLRSRIFR